MNSKKNHRKPDFRKDDIFIDNERVLKNMLDGFIVVEHDGKIIKVNPAYCEMTGYTKSELLNMNILELDAVISEKEVNSFMESMLTMTSSRFRTKHKHKDGHLIDLLVSTVIIHSDNEPLIVAFIHDIAEQINAEKAEKNSLAQYKNLFMSLTDGFYISEALFDKNGNVYDYKYLEVNPKFEKIINLNRDQIIGKRYKELVPVDTSEWLDIYSKVAITGKSMTYEFYSNEYQKNFETYCLSLIHI